MRSVLSETIAKPSFPLSGRLLAGAVGAFVTSVDFGLTRLADQLLTWQQRAHDRRALAQLDDHLLHDIGLSRADVEHEASKPFWRN